jgi:hypothetical protein
MPSLDDVIFVHILVCDISLSQMCWRAINWTSPSCGKICNVIKDNLGSRDATTGAKAPDIIPAPCPKLSPPVGPFLAPAHHAPAPSPALAPAQHAALGMLHWVCSRPKVGLRGWSGQFPVRMEAGKKPDRVMERGELALVLCPTYFGSALFKPTVVWTNVNKMIDGIYMVQASVCN